MNRLNVGKMSIYRLIPSSPILLVRYIFIIIASIFVISPPIKRIMADFINVFFIIIVKVYENFCENSLNGLLKCFVL